MKELSFSIFTLFYIKCLNPFFPKYIEDHFYIKTDEHKKQIYFECGGGYWSYYCGIVKMIKETYSQEDLNKIIWLGSSAGVFPAVTAAYLDPEISMNKMLIDLSLLPQNWYGSIYRINSLILTKCHKNFLINYEKEILSKQTKLFLAVLDINIIFPLFSSITFYYDFNTMQDFSESCITSHGIPFLTGPLNVTCITHPKKWYIKRTDCGIFTMLFGWLLGYRSFMPFIKNKYHIISPNIFRKLRVDWLWIWTNVEHNKNMYNLGYQDAIQNKEKIDEMIL